MQYAVQYAYLFSITIQVLQLKCLYLPWIKTSIFPKQLFCSCMSIFTFLMPLTFLFLLIVVPIFKHNYTLGNLKIIESCTKMQILFPFLDLIFINLFLYFICDSVMRELILLLSFSSSLSVSSDSAIDRGDTSSTELANRLVELEKELMYVPRHMTPPKSNWISYFIVIIVYIWYELPVFDHYISYINAIWSTFFGSFDLMKKTIMFHFDNIGWTLLIKLFCYFP